MKAGNKNVLITGCSSGIGRALALEFRSRGHRVFATARKAEDIRELNEAGIAAHRVDVNNASDIEKLKTEIEKECGAPDILINNAGILVVGPLSELPVERFSLQMESNVTGFLRMVQAFVPAMAVKKSGLIVNLGSVSGILPTPFAGAYCASKAAVHAMNDTLRMELAPFGIKLMCLQPGGITSSLAKNASSALAEPLKPGSLYSPISEAIVERANASQAGAMPVDKFARLVADAALSGRPPAVLRAGAQSLIMPFLRYFIPVGLRDRILMKKFRLNRL